MKTKKYFHPLICYFTQNPLAFDFLTNILLVYFGLAVNIQNFQDCVYRVRHPTGGRLSMRFNDLRLDPADKVEVGGYIWFRAGLNIIRLLGSFMWHHNLKSSNAMFFLPSPFLSISKITT